MKQTFVEKFVANKGLPNEEFSLKIPDNTTLSIDLKTTLDRIQKEGLNTEVKKVLKKGAFRNASAEICLSVFEGAAQRFLIKDFNNELADKIIQLLEKVHTRKNTVYLAVANGNGKEEFEVKFKNNDQLLTPYSLINQETQNSLMFTKRELIEYLMTKDIREVL